MKLTLEINGNKIELTKEEAQRVHSELSHFFGAVKEVISIPMPYPIYLRQLFAPSFGEPWLSPYTTC